MCDRQDSQLLFFSACFKSFSPRDSLELKSVPPYNPTMQQTLAHISSIPIPQCCSATHRLESWEQFRLGLFYDKVHIDTPFDQVLLPSGQFTQHIPSDFFARWRQVLCDFQHRGILQECLASREFRFKPSGLRLALESLIEKRWSSQFRPIQRKSLSRHWFSLSLPIAVNSTYLEVSLKKAIHWLPCAAVLAARDRHKPCLLPLWDTTTLSSAHLKLPLLFWTDLEQMPALDGAKKHCYWLLGYAAFLPWPLARCYLEKTPDALPQPWLLGHAGVSLPSLLVAWLAWPSSSLDCLVLTTRQEDLET